MVTYTLTGSDIGSERNNSKGGSRKASSFSFSKNTPRDNSTKLKENDYDIRLDISYSNDSDKLSQ